MLALGALSAHAADDKPASVAGKWESTREGRDGMTVTTVYTFEQDGDKLTGTAKLPAFPAMGERPAREAREVPLTGTIKGKKITFSYQGFGGRGGPGGPGGPGGGDRPQGDRPQGGGGDRPQGDRPQGGGGGGGGGPRAMEYIGTVDGDTMKGEFETPRGKREWTAKRAAAADAKAPEAKP
jgi:hypothetical protein